MLILKKPETAEIEIITMVHCICCNCTKEETIPATSKDAGAIQLQKLGWRAYERDGETGANACPSCVKELEEIEEEEKSYGRNESRV